MAKTGNGRLSARHPRISATRRNMNLPPNTPASHPEISKPTSPCRSHFKPLSHWVSSSQLQDGTHSGPPPIAGPGPPRAAAWLRLDAAPTRYLRLHRPRANGMLAGSHVLPPRGGNAAAPSSEARGSELTPVSQGLPMAKNLRRKLPASDTIRVFDLNQTSMDSLVKDAEEGSAGGAAVEVSASALDAAKGSVCKPTCISGTPSRLCFRGGPLFEPAQARGFHALAGSTAYLTPPPPLDHNVDFSRTPS